MKIIIPKENSYEMRVAILPQNIDKLVKKGAEITIEAGLGTSLGITDKDYNPNSLLLWQNKKFLPYRWK